MESKGGSGVGGHNGMGCNMVEVMAVRNGLFQIAFGSRADGICIWIA